MSYGYDYRVYNSVYIGCILTDTSNRYYSFYGRIFTLNDGKIIATNQKADKKIMNTLYWYIISQIKLVLYTEMVH